MRFLFLAFGLLLMSACQPQERPDFGKSDDDQQETPISTPRTDDGVGRDDDIEEPPPQAGNDDTPTVGDDDMSEDPLFGGVDSWKRVPEGSYSIGALPGQYSGYSVVPYGDFMVGTFWVDPWPWPGEGREWPMSGLNQDMMDGVTQRLAECGLRVLSMSEMLVYFSTSYNDAYPQGVDFWQDAECDPDPVEPDYIGSYPRCESRLGAQALLTFPFWGTVDDQMKKVLSGQMYFPPDYNYCLVGGMPTWWDAFYSDSLYGWHCHPRGEQAYADDPSFFVGADEDSFDRVDWACYKALKFDFDGTWGSLLIGNSAVSQTSNSGSGKTHYYHSQVR